MQFFCQIYFLLWALALIDHLIHNAVFLRLLGREEMVALAVAGDLFNGSAGVLRQNFDSDGASHPRCAGRGSRYP